MARIPLICFDVVEWHYPDRVMRQFACVQSIPAPCDTSLRLHQTDRRGRARSSWDVVHTAHIATWSAWRQHIVTGSPIVAGVAHSQDYMEWYRRITRICVGRSAYPTPGYEGEAASYELLHERFQQVDRDLDRAIYSTSADDRIQILMDMKVMVRDTLHAIGHAHVRSTPTAARADTVPTTTPSPSDFQTQSLPDLSQMTHAGEGTSGTHEDLGLQIAEIADTDITPLDAVDVPAVAHPGTIPTQEAISHVISEERRPMTHYVRRSTRVRRPPTHGCGT